MLETLNILFSADNNFTPSEKLIVAFLISRQGEVALHEISTACKLPFIEVETRVSFLVSLGILKASEDKIKFLTLCPTAGVACAPARENFTQNPPNSPLKGDAQNLSDSSENADSVCSAHAPGPVVKTTVFTEGPPENHVNTNNNILLSPDNNTIINRSKYNPAPLRAKQLIRAGDLYKKKIGENTPEIGNTIPEPEKGAPTLKVLDILNTSSELVKRCRGKIIRKFMEVVQEKTSVQICLGNTPGSNPDRDVSSLLKSKWWLGKTARDLRLCFFDDNDAALLRKANEFWLSKLDAYFEDDFWCKVLFSTSNLQKFSVSTSLRGSKRPKSKLGDVKQDDKYRVVVQIYPDKLDSAFKEYLGHKGAFIPGHIDVVYYDLLDSSDQKLLVKCKAMSPRMRYAGDFTAGS